MGLAFGKQELLESWRAVQGAAGGERAGRAPLRARDEPARAPRRLRRGGRLHATRSAGTRCSSHERALGERFLAGLPDDVELYGLRDDGRARPDVLLQRPGHSAEEVATFLAERDDRGLARRLLRGRDDEAPRARRTAPCAPASSTTTPRTRSTGCSTGSPRSREAAPSRRAAVPRPRDRGRGARARPRAHVLQPRARRTPSSIRRSSGSSATAAAISAALARTHLGRRDRHVRLSARARFAHRPRHSPDCGLYCFVSSISVYADFSSDERRGQRARRARRPARRRGDGGELRAAEGALRGRRSQTCSRRDRSSCGRGSSSGPHDPTGRFTYWPHRIARGGEVLAPAPPERRTQVDRRARSRRVDGRALRAGRRRHVQRDAPGVTWSELVETCTAVSGSDAAITWVPDDFLLEHEVGQWMELPLWLADPALAAADESNVERALGGRLHVPSARGDGAGRTRATPRRPTPPVSHRARGRAPRGVAWPRVRIGRAVGEAAGRGLAPTL